MKPAQFQKEEGPKQKREAIPQNQYLYDMYMRECESCDAVCTIAKDNKAKAGENIARSDSEGPLGPSSRVATFWSQ